ncbi:hypothetical protein [Ileibacterium valens]|uniref:hypothetical protein n=1 Tax=Ileibacterium valens TaxID=1862668 RepID=UPI00272C1EDE|nr:hypothetical protein [Ileibacterium valens]
MLGGNVNEFVDDLPYGFEQVFMYKGKKYFIQSLTIDGKPYLLLDQWDPQAMIISGRKLGKIHFQLMNFSKHLFGMEGVFGRLRMKWNGSTAKLLENGNECLTYNLFLLEA